MGRKVISLTCPLLAEVVMPQLSGGAVVSAHLLNEHFCVVNSVTGALKDK